MILTKPSLIDLAISPLANQPSASSTAAVGSGLLVVAGEDRVAAHQDLAVGVEPELEPGDRPATVPIRNSSGKFEVAELLHS